MTKGPETKKSEIEAKLEKMIKSIGNIVGPNVIHSKDVFKTIINYGVETEMEHCEHGCEKPNDFNEKRKNC